MCIRPKRRAELQCYREHAMQLISRKYVRVLTDTPWARECSLRVKKPIVARREEGNLTSSKEPLTLTNKLVVCVTVAAGNSLQEIRGNIHGRKVFKVLPFPLPLPFRSYNPLFHLYIQLMAPLPQDG